MAVLRVLEMVPLDLTLYVVCSMQCHAGVMINLDRWSLNDWRQWDG